MRTLYCRHDHCGKPYDSIAGDQPHICPACGLAAHWTTDPQYRVKVRSRQKGPRVPFDLTFNDRRLLKAARIAVDG